MDYITGILVPSLIILIANIFSGNYGSYRYECITALFGWTACISLVLYLLVLLFLVFFPSAWLQYGKQLLLAVFYFSIITAISRDYEKILKPFVSSSRKKK